MVGKHSINRRVAITALGTAFFTTRGLFAEELSTTPWTTEGPFYPDRLPLDQDNDLIIVGDQTTPAVGEISHLTGRILDSKGEPLKDATIEIWQCDANAVYLHSRDSDRKKDQQDKNFQGYGQFTTGSTGEYRFRTIKPVPYPGRPAPHIHVKISKGDRPLLITQIFIAGHPGNAQDGVFRGLRSAEDQKLASAEFTPVPDSKINELAASRDLIIGRTPDERGPGFRRGGRDRSE